MRKSEQTLTAKQLRWVDEILIDGNATAAAVRAGYSERSARSIAHENMSKPDIQAVLAERRRVVAGRLQITREGVLKGLLDAVELARSQSNPAGMIAGLVQIGKLQGYYAPETRRVELMADPETFTRHLERLSDQELMAIVASAGD